MIFETLNNITKNFNINAIERIMNEMLFNITLITMNSKTHKK